MSPHADICPLCGQMHAREPGRTLCQLCYDTREQDIFLIEQAILTHGLTRSEDIADQTDLPIEEVRLLIEETGGFAEELVDKSLCRRCHKVRAQKNSEYCFSCRMDLYKAINDARGELLARVGALRKVTHASPMGKVGDALEQKRARAAASRFAPSPRRIR